MTNTLISAFIGVEKDENKNYACIRLVEAKKKRKESLLEELGNTLHKLIHYSHD